MQGVGFKAGRWRGWVLAAAVAAAGFAAPARAQVAGAADRWFTTSDGVRLHYLEAGAPGARSIVLVPGWAMPAWIFAAQIKEFARDWHVLALDPRGQGESQVAAAGYEPHRRARDIDELIAAAGGGQVVLLGWSLGVLDSLAYVHDEGDAHVAGLVLVDNSVGEEPPPKPRPKPRKPVPPMSYDQRMAAFVRGMFHRPQDTAWLDRLTQAALHLPEPASRRLLSYPEPRSFWKEGVYATSHPVLYVVRPGLAAQAANLEAHHPAAEIALFPDAGHALFVDEAERFDHLVSDFIHRRVWPGSAS